MGRIPPLKEPHIWDWGFKLLAYSRQTCERSCRFARQEKKPLFFRLRESPVSSTQPFEICQFRLLCACPARCPIQYPALPVNCRNALHKKPAVKKFSCYVPKTFDCCFHTLGPDTIKWHQLEKNLSSPFWDMATLMVKIWQPWKRKFIFIGF